MHPRYLSILAGASYIVIFFAAIYANFFALETLLQDPVTTATQHGTMIRFGAFAFMIAAVFDVIVAWALYELYKSNPLSSLSTFFRVIHAAIMGAGVFALMSTIGMTNKEAILDQAQTFTTLWLIGLFFFGAHLLLLGRIVQHIIFIPSMLIVAGAMYMLDTSAQILLSNYASYADTFLILVALPALFGEMAFALWLLHKGGKPNHEITPPAHSPVST